jgi:hypothetical protein
MVKQSDKKEMRRTNKRVIKMYDVKKQHKAKEQRKQRIYHVSNQFFQRSRLNK